MIASVIAVGGLVGSIAATALFFVFRALGDEKRDRRPPVTLIAALVSFLFLCCAVLFWASWQ